MCICGGKQEQCILEGEIKQQYTLEGDWVESSFKRRPHYLSPSKKTHFTGCSHLIRKGRVGQFMTISKDRGVLEPIILLICEQLLSVDVL